MTETHPKYDTKVYCQLCKEKTMQSQDIIKGELYNSTTLGHPSTDRISIFICSKCGIITRQDPKIKRGDTT